MTDHKYTAGDAVWFGYDGTKVGHVLDAVEAAAATLGQWPGGEE
jgi:hypothetical protein